MQIHSPRGARSTNMRVGLHNASVIAGLNSSRDLPIQSSLSSTVPGESLYACGDVVQNKMSAGSKNFESLDFDGAKHLTSSQRRVLHLLDRFDG